MAAKKHTHKYEKIEDLWCCVRPDCSHFMPKNVRGGSIEGKITICHDCGEEFVLTLPLMKIDKPRCYPCARIFAGVPQVDITDDQLEEYLKGQSDTK